MRHVSLPGAAVLAALAWSGPARAADQTDSQDPWIGAAAAVSHQFDSDLATGGSVSVTRWSLAPRLGRGNGPGDVFAPLSVGMSHYAFGAGGALGAGSAWDDIVDVRLSLPLEIRQGDRMTARVIPGIAYSGETGVAAGDATTVSLLAGLEWRLSDRLSLGPGLQWSTELEDEDSLTPVVFLDWAVTDRLSLSTGSGHGVSRGPGLTLTWQAGDDLAVAFSGRYEKRRFRLDGDGPAPGGVGQDAAVPLMVTVNYAPTAALRVTGFAGVKLNGALRMEDASGATLSSSEYDPAPVLGAALSLRF